MLPFLHRLSAILFYVLGSSFFLAYIFLRNSILGVWPAVWLQVADLPLIFVGLFYGGLSLYRSIERPESPSRALPWVIGVPLIVTFITLAVCNFWPAGPIF